MAAEALLHHIWQHRLWRPATLTTTAGEEVEVVNPGWLNTDAGPDFFNAHLRIGRQDWVGNVEVHVHASDWHRHGHHRDRAYDTVVLHVVQHDDCAVSRPDGSVIAQVSLPGVEAIEAKYGRLADNPHRPRCAGSLAAIPSIYRTDWITALAHQRIQQKTERLQLILDDCSGHWPAAAYVLLARSLGFATNSDAFERLARCTPLPYLQKHGGDLPLIEAALFGQAGLLDVLPAATQSQPYIARLIDDHRFLCAKYGLQRPSSLGWRLARMRPPNFPHRRIAALATLVSQGFALGTGFAHIHTAADAAALLQAALSPFWQTHYHFGAEAPRFAPALGKAAIHSLIINTVVPLMYAYGLAFAREDLCSRALELLQQLPPENNVVVRGFADSGLPGSNAFDTQAIIQLRRAYCDPANCLRCRFSMRM